MKISKRGLEILCKKIHDFMKLSNVTGNALDLIMTNLITPRALFSPLVKPKLAPFDPPTPKTPS